MTWVKKWEVPSDSSPGKYYTVAYDDQGFYGCSCRGWTSHRDNKGKSMSERRPCKHIERIKSQYRSGVFTAGDESKKIKLVEEAEYFEWKQRMEERAKARAKEEREALNLMRKMREEEKAAAMVYRYGKWKSNTVEVKKPVAKQAIDREFIPAQRVSRKFNFDE